MGNLFVEYIIGYNLTDGYMLGIPPSNMKYPSWNVSQSILAPLGSNIRKVHLISMNPMNIWHGMGTETELHNTFEKLR